MTESHYKSGRKKGFVVLMRDVAQDDRLSLETRGLFALMVSLPENWEYSVSGLAKKAGCGKDKIRRLLKELETVGYLIREQSHANGGKFGENIYILQDEAPPSSGKTDNGENRQRLEPMTGNPTQNNKDLKEQENKIPPISPKGDERGRGKTAPKYRPEWFERFWAKYPPRQGRKEHKREAAKAWDKLKPDYELCQIMSKALDPGSWPKRWHDEDGRYIPLASTWLNNGRWEVELVDSVAAPAPVAPRKFHMEVIDGEEVVVYDD